MPHRLVAPRLVRIYQSCGRGTSRRSGGMPIPDKSSGTPFCHCMANVDGHVDCLERRDDVEIWCKNIDHSWPVRLRVK